MTYTKILVGLAILLCAIAATTTPANAWFEANTQGATTGPTTLPETATFNQIQSGTTVAVATCTNNATSKAAAFWTIQNSEETIVNNVTKGGGTKEQKQPETKVGSHEAITVQRWGACTVTVGATRLTANVSECRLQIAQPNKSTAEEQLSGLGSVQTDCLIEVPAAACTIVVNQTKTNHNLRAIILFREATKVGINLKITGITDSVKGAGCTAGGITATATAEFNAKEIKNVGQELI